MLAADWVRSGAARGRKALVVATDIARYDIGSSAEFTQGAGAAAVVVSEEPRLARARPDDRGVRAQRLRLLAAARPPRGAGRRQVLARLLPRRAARRGGRLPLGAERSRAAASLLERFAAFLYHTPFPKMAHKAHRRLVEDESPGLTPAAVGERFERSWSTQAEPALGLARAGGQHLHGVALPLPRVAPRARGGDARGPRAGALLLRLGLLRRVLHRAPGARQRVARRAHRGAGAPAGAPQLTVAEYEEFARAGAGAERPAEGGAGFCHLAGIEDHKRRYARSGAPA